MTIVETTPEPELKEVVEEEKKDDVVTPKKPSVGRLTDVFEPDRINFDLAAMSDEAQRIIEEAQARLNALSRGEYSNGGLRPGVTLEAAAILTAGELANGRTLACGEFSPETG